MRRQDWQRICDSLRSAGLAVDAETLPRPIGGGDISAAWRCRTAEGPVFLKTGDAGAFDMFEAEACGLSELAAADAVRVPAVLATVRYGDGACLALEWLNLQSGAANAGRSLGRQLAALHRRTQADYGWSRDNTIGRTPQRNPLSGDWPAFYREHRLGCQLELAAVNGYGGELQALGGKLLERLERFFGGFEPPASLLHGDLWAGNWSCCDGQPVIYDPAVYFGDRETDIAMTRLFGGFGVEFYDAYAGVWPLPDGHERRVELYQLYHVLNHLNLFGGGYLARAISMMKNLLRISA